MANDVKWIKIATDCFNDEKIMLLESMPEADTIIVIWFKLLTLAGKQHNDGVFWLTDRIAYTDELLATIFRRNLNTVRMALARFEELGMIEIINNVITIPNWNKYQNFDALDRKRERDRQYMRDYRQRQKALAEGAGEGPLPDPPALPQGDGEEFGVPRVPEEPKGPPVPPKEPARRKLSDVDRVLEAWNGIKNIRHVRNIVPGKNRDSMLRARIRENGIDNVLEAIANIDKSSFLKGNSKKGWQITFDWFIRPNNFAKVLDGNYVDEDVSEGQGQQKKQTLTRPRKFVTIIEDGYEVEVEVRDDDPGADI